MTNPIYRVVRALNDRAEADRIRCNRRSYDIDRDFETPGIGNYFYGEGRIKIRMGGHMGNNSTIYAAPGTTVEIGYNCGISHNVRIYSGMRTVAGSWKKGNIKIGDDVWICANAYIGPGVIIGNKAVIGASTVITRNVPENGIVKARGEESWTTKTESKDGSRGF